MKATKKKHETKQTPPTSIIFRYLKGKYTLWNQFVFTFSFIMFLYSTCYLFFLFKNTWQKKVFFGGQWTD